MTDQDEFKLTARADGDTMTVSARGDVDASNSYAISAIVTTALEMVRVQRVVVDLSGVDFMDSSGITALVTCLKDLRAVGVDFEVVGASSEPLRLLETTGVLSSLSSLSDEVQTKAS